MPPPNAALTTFKGQVAVVSGGGGGIGRATALLLAERGATVTVLGRTEDSLRETAEHIRALGGDGAYLVADLSNEHDARSAMETVYDRGGSLDLAVNAAGAVGVGSLVDTPLEVYREVLDSNLLATWLSMKNQLPYMLRAGSGAIVNVASRAGLVGTPGGSIYSAAKHAVVGLTRSAALEAGPSGVRINAVCPGPTKTNQFDDIVRLAMPDLSPEQAADMLGGKLPLGRIAHPVEIAEAIAWLLGPAASFITGAAVPVDGGGGAG